MTEKEGTLRFPHFWTQLNWGQITWNTQEINLSIGRRIWFLEMLEEDSMVGVRYMEINWGRKRMLSCREKGTLFMESKKGEKGRGLERVWNQIQQEENLLNHILGRWSNWVSQVLQTASLTQLWGFRSMGKQSRSMSSWGGGGLWPRSTHKVV